MISRRRILREEIDQVYNTRGAGDGLCSRPVALECLAWYALSDGEGVGGRDVVDEPKEALNGEGVLGIE